ncbi:hypothetical protein [Flavobacterium luteolum]|uniref:hypothetical protein n=1 Tax=Flavobacterium luteolum TaxID=3003259 RepID=UPI00248DED95|nr:hypothetical protein [Flavobacterium luteolum]
MIRKALLVLISIFLLQSCNVGTSGTWKNESIEKDKKEEIKLLNDKLFKAIMSNDVKGVRALLVDKLIEKDGDKIDKLINDISTTYKSESYRVLDEYNVENSSTNISNTLLSGASKDNDYVINYLALNKDMYTSLFIPNGHSNEILFTIIYGKYDDEWKINIFRVGQYSLLKQTAPDYYKLAQESYKKASLIDAVNYSSLAKQCLRPADENFKYKKENEINDFHNKLMNEVNSKFSLPLTFENIESKPKLCSIYPQVTAEGYFPMICYYSNINLKDTTALKIENNKVKTEVNKLFTGLYKDKKAVLYRIYNEMPDGKKIIDHYGIVDKIKN